MERFDMYEFQGDRDNRDDGEDYDEYGEDYGDEDNEDGNQYEVGFKEAQHMSKEDACGSIPEMFIKKGVNTYTSLKNAVHFLRSNPEARFKIFVKAIAIQLDNDKVFKITDNDRNIMCLQADKLKNTKYLNPTAYVLAYICTKGGGEIDKKIFSKILNSMNEIDDDSVKPADIIRYSRFIQKNFE